MARKLTPIFAVLALATLLISSCGTPDRAAQQPAAPAAAAATVPPAPIAAAPQTAPQAARLPADQLYIHDNDGSGAGRLAILNAVSGERERDLPLGVASPDWSTLYTVESTVANDHAKTHIQALDLKTGRPVRETTIDGAYVLPTVSVDGMPGGLSPNGLWLVLREAPGQHVGRWQSQFAVLDTGFKQPPRRVDLDVDGPYQFDGINNGGDALYLIQYLTSSQPATYQVRYYNLALGALDSQVVVAKGEDQVMAGTHHTSIAAPNGAWRYSLYMNNQYGPFIHALGLDDHIAICIDLPKTGKDDEEKQLSWSMALSKDRTRLYAVNGALGLVSDLRINGGVPEVMRTATLAAPTASTSPLSGLAALFAAPVAEAKPEHGLPVGEAVVSPDGKTLFALGARGLLVIDTSDLTLRGRYLPDMMLSSVALSADGARLYTVSAEQSKIIQLDPATGATLAEISGARQPSGVLRVETQK